ncbi:MoaD/ThiS family protein [Nocardia thraciensis]
MVEVRYFAAIADAVGKSSERLDLSAEATVGDLRRTLAAAYGPDLEPMLKVCAFLLDDELTRDESMPLTARVDVLPPFAGG